MPVPWYDPPVSRENDKDAKTTGCMVPPSCLHELRSPFVCVQGFQALYLAYPGHVNWLHWMLWGKAEGEEGGERPGAEEKVRNCLCKIN